MKRSFISWARDWVSLTWQRFRELLSAARHDRLIWTGLIVLLAIDLVFSLWFAGTRLLLNLEINEYLYELRFLRIDADGGWPEWFGYAKTLLLILLLGRLTLSTRQLIYPALVFVFAIVLLDDSLEIHEELGKHLVGVLGLRPMLGVRARDVGEVITWAALGAIALPPVVAGLVFSKRTHVANGLALLLPFAGLLFFAIFIDQVYHVWRDAFFGADIVLATLEDGGEMVVISVNCALAAVLVRGGPAAHPG
jgi:hypothetical protein